jgi:hypothetical protein
MSKEKAGYIAQFPGTYMWTCLLTCWVKNVQSTDHELIPARNASLAAMTVPLAEVISITIQRENIRPSKKEMNKAVTMLSCPMFAVRL